MGRLVLDFFSGKFDNPFCYLGIIDTQKTRYGSQGCGFARSVNSQQGDDLVFVHIQRYPLDSGRNMVINHL